MLAERAAICAAGLSPWRPVGVRRQIAFSLFTKSRAAAFGCRSFLGDSEYVPCAPTLTNRISPAEHEPLFVAPSISDELELQAAATPAGAGPHLHCCYTFVGSDAAQHACVCWSDSSGRTLDVGCLLCVGLPLEECVQLVWEHGARVQARQIAETGTVRVAVLKWGALSPAEVAAWEGVVGDLGDRDGRPTAMAGSGGWQRQLPLPLTRLAAATPRAFLPADAHAAVSLFGVRGLPARRLAGTATEPAKAAAGLSADDAHAAADAYASRAGAAALLLPSRSSSAEGTAYLLQSARALKLDLRLHLTRAGGEQHDGAPSDDGTSAELDRCALLRLVGAELYGLAWLTATPPSGPSSSFEQRWSELPLHCAVVERLAELTEWMLNEGLGGDDDDNEDEDERAAA